VPAAASKRAGRNFDWRSFLPPTLRAHLEQQRKPSLQELATFTQQLANLLQAGMPLSTALNSMTYLETKGIPSDVSRQLKQEVSEGRGLSDAMAKQPRIFSDLYVNMVKAGESSGALVDVLRRMADHFEKFAQVQAKFTSALIYPALVCCVGVGMIVFFLTVMLPKFMSLFGDVGFKNLPMMTVILINISDAFKHYWWLMAGIVIVAFILFKRFQATPAGRRAIDGWKMKAPLLGRVVCLNLYGQFARTLCTLLQNGVPMLTALKITEQVIPNSIIKEATARTRDAVTDGKSLAQPLAASKVFPRLMVDLVKIGEETGNVADALNNVAQTYENELNIALRVTTNLIEPVLIIGMAAGVGFLLVAVLGAMFSMISSIGTGMGGN
jgi:type II secretory pathway component PulF